MTPDEKEISRFDVADTNEDQKQRMKAFRHDFKKLAAYILKFCPQSADRSAAMRYLRLAHMQVNSAICHDWPEEKND